jgi:hypothetical protein
MTCAHGCHTYRWHFRASVDDTGHVLQSIAFSRCMIYSWRSACGRLDLTTSIVSVFLRSGLSLVCVFVCVCVSVSVCVSVCLSVYMHV